MSDKIHPADVYEGDRVTMRISPHNYDSTGATITGEVTKAPRHEVDREMLREGERLMVDYTVEADDGTVWTWNVDNGYVIGHHEALGRRSDIGRFRRFEATD